MTFHVCCCKYPYLVKVRCYLSALYIAVQLRRITEGSIMCVCQVESLTAARSAAQAGTEPSDAIRVVNSVLTQLDQIKRSVSLDLCCTFIYKGMLEIKMTIYLMHFAALIVHYSSWRLLQIIVVFHQNIITRSAIFFPFLSDAIVPSFLCHWISWCILKYILSYGSKNRASCAVCLFI